MTTAMTTPRHDAGAFVLAAGAAVDLPGLSGGMLAPLALGYIGGAAIGVGIAVAGHGLLAAFAAAWLSAIVLTVAIPAALLARPRRAPAAAPADLAAWQTDLAEELKAERAARGAA
ncbi:hypothetical protein [uncultured Albimonas sp.]|uniref:hypothetical protein n=1 Tax=uncultured Albimonas sp. TaxID=1331701 RepID=UPI0030EB6EDA